jgi:hypothetical protein
VVDDQLGDDAQTPLMRRVHEATEFLHRTVGRVHLAVVADIVTVVAQRRGIERHQPDRGDAKVTHVIELLRQALEIADPVIVRVEERLDVNLIDDGVTVPLRIAAIDHRVVASYVEFKGMFGIPVPIPA